MHDYYPSTDVINRYRLDRDLLDQMSEQNRGDYVKQHETFASVLENVPAWMLQDELDRRGPGGEGPNTVEKWAWV